jgi:hypothetical protein
VKTATRKAGDNHSVLELSRLRVLALVMFALATVLLIPLHQHAVGTVVWGLALFLVLRDSRAEVKRRMGTLLGCVAILAVCDINTSTTLGNFLQVGIPFALVIVLPPLVFARTDPGVIRFRFRPRKRWGRDLLYTVISIPLSWAVLKFYWAVNPDLYRQWALSPEMGRAEVGRLFAGINLVGVWDELFFVNTVFATLRSLFCFPLANALQALVYTSVLNDMAFVGIGPLIVFCFAWTQGFMFERSDNLAFVLIVHLIVDFFLVAAILNSYDPRFGLDYLWRHGL